MKGETPHPKAVLFFCTRVCSMKRFSLPQNRLEICFFFNQMKLHSNTIHNGFFLFDIFFYLTLFSGENDLLRTSCMGSDVRRWDRDRFLHVGNHVSVEYKRFGFRYLHVFPFRNWTKWNGSEVTIQWFRSHLSKYFLCRCKYWMFLLMCFLMSPSPQRKMIICHRCVLSDRKPQGIAYF